MFEYDIPMSILSVILRSVEFHSEIDDKYKVYQLWSERRRSSAG